MYNLLMGVCILLAVWRWFQTSDPTQPPVWPGRLPLLGHGLLFLGDSVKMFDNVKEISVAAAKMGGWIRVYFGPRLFYVVADPEDSLKVSTACIQKHYIYNFMKPFLENGLFNADVPTWKKHWKMLSPAFSQQVFDGFIETFNCQALSLVDRFKGEVGKPFDHEKHLRINNLETICGKYRPFFDLIIELAKDNPSLTDQQILGETNTIIAAGHDTTASALTFALTLLGSHPEVQDKAYKEIFEVLGDSKNVIDKADLSKLVYIEAIAKESVRLYPSGPVIARTLDQDIQIKNYILKAGASCVVSLYGVNRHPIWGPDADKFRPERWFEKDSLPDSKYFASFGFGRRTCIGKTYAMMSMKILIAHVIRSFTITSDISKMVVKMDTMIRPVEGFHIALQSRD